jgi:dipeptidyl aminopeptidase/acylaminoacyl peptidase
MPVIVAGRYLAYFDPEQGLMARAFEPSTLELGPAVLFVDDVRPMNEGQGMHGRISANGTLVYLRGSHIEQVVTGELASLDSSGRLERLDLAAGSIQHVASSPNGERFAVQVGDGRPEGSNDAIWIYDRTGAVAPQLLTLEGESAVPAWSPDSLSLVFGSDRGADRLRIWLQPFDGSSQAVPVTEPADGTLHVSPALSPDGLLVYTEASPNGDEADVFIKALPNGEREQFLEGAGFQSEVSFSPDGRAYAYQSNGDIWIARYLRDRSTPRLISDGLGTARAPVWSHDSKRVAYVSGDAGIAIENIDTEDLNKLPGGKVFAVPLSPRPNRLAGQRQIAAGPDSDSWFVVVEPEARGEGTVAEIVIIENWVEELDARVPPL